MSDYYRMEMICDNCRIEQVKIFKKGEECNGFYLCPECGCVKLRRR